MFRFPLPRNQERMRLNLEAWKERRNKPYPEKPHNSYMIGRPLYKEAEDPEAFLTQSVVNHLESFKNEAPYIEEKEAAKFDDILFINHIDQTHKQRKSYNQHRLCIIQLQVDMKRQVLLKNQRYATQIQRRFSRHIHSPIHKKAQNDGWGRQR